MRTRRVPPLVAPRALLGETLDGVVEGGMAAFAVWTLLYLCALSTGWSLWWLSAAWCVGVVGGAVFAVLRRVRGWSSAGPVGHDETVPLARLKLRHPRLFAALLGWAVIGAVFLSVRLLEPDFWLILGLMVVCVPAALALSSGRPEHDPVEGDGPHWHHAIVLLCGTAFAGLSLVLLRPDADDVYYVNRAVWAADHGTAVATDTLFGPGVFPNTYAGGVLPLSSVESLDGALAHLSGISAASFTYLVTAPLIAFFSVWIMWRLVRAWAPRQRLTVFLVAFVFVLYSGVSIVGNYSIGRIWQGKVTAYVLLLPLVWVVATRLLERRRGWDLVMMLVLGVAFVGFTSSATILGPAVGAGLLLVAALVRSRFLAVGAVLFTLPPVLAGVAVTVLSPGVAHSATGSPLPSRTPWQSFVIAFGSRPVLTGLGVLALLLAPVLVRRGAPSYLTAAAALIFLGSLLPGVTDLMNATTGAGPVLWRFSLVLPLPVLVGTVAAAPLRLSSQLSQADASRLVGGFLVAVVAAAGVPLWSPALSTQLTSRPTWKVDQAAQPLAVQISRLDTGPGPVLLPPEVMNVLAVTTTRMFAVVPRYLGAVQESPEKAKARGQLLGLVQHSKPLLGYPQTDAALSALDVSLVCAPTSDHAVLRRVRASGYEARKRVGPLTCLVPRRLP